MANSCFFNCYLLEAIAFEPGTIKIDLNIGTSPLLSNQSMISIANGLDGTAGKTLTMQNTDNVMVDNVAGVAVAGETMTLRNFITTIKNWAVA